MNTGINVLFSFLSCCLSALFVLCLLVTLQKLKSSTFLVIQQVRIFSSGPRIGKITNSSGQQIASVNYTVEVDPSYGVVSIVLNRDPSFSGSLFELNTKDESSNRVYAYKASATNGNTEFVIYDNKLVTQLVSHKSIRLILADEQSGLMVNMGTITSNLEDLIYDREPYDQAVALVESDLLEDAVSVLLDYRYSDYNSFSYYGCSNLLKSTQNEVAYRQAVALSEKGEYDSALQLFDSIKTYNDSQTLANEIRSKLITTSGKGWLGYRLRYD